MKALFTFLFFVLIVPVSAGDYHYIQTPQRLDKEALIEEIEEGKERGKTVVIKLDVRPDKDEITERLFNKTVMLSDGEITTECKTGGDRIEWRLKGNLWYEVTGFRNDVLSLRIIGQDKPR